MGLKTTSSTKTSDGPSAAVYSRIKTDIESKDENHVQLFVSHYKDKAEFLAGEDVITSSQLKETYTFPIVTDQWRLDNGPDKDTPDNGIYNFTRTELEAANKYIVYHGKLKALLVHEGRTTVDDI